MPNSGASGWTWVAEFFDHVFRTPILLGLVLLLAVALVHFFVQYLVRGVRLRSRLVAVAARVTSTKGEAPLTIKEKLGAIFAGTRMAPAWQEYEETLHEQVEYVAGERRTTAIRATVPAQHFINSETVVDPWLGSEYFKHLPGILTGMGIIGTFYGLISGLTRFDLNISNPGLLTTSLKGLFLEVQYAFTFSGFAIASAIVVTFIEKWLYSACAKWVGELTQALDALFRAGVGEEYLSSLVQASQESASQTRQLKESLVDEFKVLLTNLSERQVEATRQMTVDLGAQIETSLKQPLQDIAETVKVASGNQTQATGAVLENLMTAFMAQMRESVGGQMGDLSALLTQTATSMSQVELTMRSLVEDMKRAGGTQTDAVSAAMRDLLLKLDEHQQQQGKAVAASTQVVMDKLQVAITKMAEAQEAANQKTQAVVTQTVSAMQGRVDGLTESNQRLTEATQEATGRIQSTASDMVEKLAAATANVEKALLGMGEVTERMSLLARQLTGLEAQTLQASQANTQATSNLATASQAMAGSVAKLSETAVRLEAVSRTSATEADIRAALVKDLQRAAELSREAGSQFTMLSEQVKSQLMANVETFGTGVGQVLTKHLSDYEKQLGTSVNMLRNALEELAEYANSQQE